MRLEDALVGRVAYQDASGDQIALLLSELDVKTPREPEDFELKVPEGTRILNHEAAKDGAPRP